MSINRDYARVGTRAFRPAKALSFIFGALFLLCAGSSAMAAVGAGTATLLTPLNNATLDRRDPPQLSWAQGNPPATWFEIQINKNGSAYLDFWLRANTFSATNFWTTNTMGDGTYTWRVRTYGNGYGDWSGFWTFTVAGGTPHVIRGISPQGTTESSASLTYAWYAPDNYTTWYELYINRNGALHSDTWHTVAPGDLETSINGQLTQLALTFKNQPSGNYSWWVRGWSPDGMGPWSTGMAFTNQLTKSGTITFLTPANGAVISNSVPQCSWQNNGGATWYSLYLIRNGATYSSQWLEGTTTWTPSSTLPVGKYTLWIAPWNPDGYGSWASVSFSVPFRVPGNLTFNGPTGKMCENSPMTYSWVADPNAAWYQLVILKGSSTLVNRLYPASASQSWDTNNFEIEVPEQHGAGNYRWWVCGWSPDGYGPWSSTNFMVFGANEVMPLAPSSWTGNFTVTTNTTAKTHFIDKLTFNDDNTFTGSGTYQLFTLPYDITATPETYSGTYSIDNGTITAEGNEFLNGQPEGSFSFNFSFDTTHQHITSGVWIDSWDNQQQFLITPDSNMPYVTIINRLCGQ
jgi:hypothetical protein